MASQQAASSGTAMSTPQHEEFTVRIPRDSRKKFTMMKFGSGSSLDFSKLGEQSVKIERENNLKEYKTANDLDLLPKFGAGSEYGRDQKEESRRKKYGIMLKKYIPEDQPWLLKIGSGKQGKRYKGVREGTIAENTSYYIFTKAADGAFEAFPVKEWYNFNPVVQYKYLNSEEAEEHFSRRDKELNLFNIMWKKRMKKEENDIDDDEEEGGKKGKKKSKQKNMILTDMEEWDDFQVSDDDDDDDGDDDDNDEDKLNKEEKQMKKKKGKGAIKKKGTKNYKKNSDDEAVEESDEGDYDDREIKLSTGMRCEPEEEPLIDPKIYINETGLEVDYMSDSGSSASILGPEEDAMEKKYQEKGVDEETGLRNILDSEAEDDEESEEKDELEDDMDDKDEKKDDKSKGSDESSQSSSEDDSDIEKEAKLASIFLQKRDKKEKKDKAENSATDITDSPKVTNTPLPDKQQKEKDKGLKRKAEKTMDGKPQSAKKHRTEDSEGITEDAIRRYLMRKPMTTKDLLQKFRAKKLNMANDKITNVIAQLLKKINPEKKTINTKLYLSLRKPE